MSPYFLIFVCWYFLIASVLYCVAGHLTKTVTGKVAVIMIAVVFATVLTGLIYGIIWAARA